MYNNPTDGYVNIHTHTHTHTHVLHLMLCTFTNMFYDNQTCRTRLNTQKTRFA